MMFRTIPKILQPLNSQFYECSGRPARSIGNRAAPVIMKNDAELGEQRSRGQKPHTEAAWLCCTRKSTTVIQNRDTQFFRKCDKHNLNAFIGAVFHLRYNGVFDEFQHSESYQAVGYRATGEGNPGHPIDDGRKIGLMPNGQFDTLAVFVIVQNSPPMTQQGIIQRFMSAQRSMH